MTTPVNCPNCGSQLPPGAPQCARCGERFDVEAEPVAPSAPVAQAPPPPKPASATPPPRVSTGTGPASSGDVGKATQQYLSELRERWGLEATPFFIGVIVLAAAAFLIGTIAHISLLTSSTNEVSKRLDDGVWLTSATALAFGAFVIAILVRYEAPRTQPPPDRQSIDFRVGIAIGGLALLFAIISVITGMGGHDDTAEAWSRYSTVFAFGAATWFVLSQPVPPMLGTTKATTIGVAIAGVALVMLVIGQIQAMSNSFDSYIGGLAWQAMAINVIVLDLGWFLGMQPRRM